MHLWPEAVRRQQQQAAEQQHRLWQAVSIFRTGYAGLGAVSTPSWPQKLDAKDWRNGYMGQRRGITDPRARKGVTWGCDVSTGGYIAGGIMPRSLRCASRRATIRREEKVGPLRSHLRRAGGMTRGLGPCRDGVQRAGSLRENEAGEKICGRLQGPAAYKLRRR